MAKAFVTSSRATCPRRSVGAVLVRDNFELVSGYNGSPTGMKHCTEVGCKMVHGHCKRAMHAERNALATALKHGINVTGAICYATTLPCWDCYQLLYQAGIVKVVYVDDYSHPDAHEVLRGPIPVQHMTTEFQWSFGY